MIKKTILIIFTIFWMTTIFMFSNQKAKLSTNNSQSFIKSTIVNIYKIFDNNASEEKISEIIEVFNVPIRKIAHFTEYFILGLLIYFTFKEFEMNNLYIMILICFLYACSDEIHQLFIDGRSCSFIDVMIDTLGSALSIWVFTKRKIKIAKE